MRKQAIERGAGAQGGLGATPPGIRAGGVVASPRRNNHYNESGGVNAASFPRSWYPRSGGGGVGMPGDRGPEYSGPLGVFCGLKMGIAGTSFALARKLPYFHLSWYPRSGGGGVGMPGDRGPEYSGPLGVFCGLKMGIAGTSFALARKLPYFHLYLRDNGRMEKARKPTVDAGLREY